MIEAKPELAATSMEEARLLTGFTAHELMTPLRAIGTTADYMARKLTEGDFDAADMALLAADISRETANMTDELQALRSLARPGHDQLVAVDLNRVVSDVLGRLDHELTESKAVVAVDPLPTVLGRSAHLRTVFSNLVSNAVRFRSQRDLEIHITAQTDYDGSHVITVADNGRGIGADRGSDHNWIFDPYTRENDGPPGTGLGLALAHRLVTLLGGSIRVESKPGHGARFLVRLVTA